MKPKSFKLKIQEFAQTEMLNTKGGAASQAKLKTTICTGKKKIQQEVF